MQFRPNSNKHKDIILDLAPLIDVVLLVLIFLMVTATFIKVGGVQVNLPSTESASLNGPLQETLVISVDFKGDYYVNSDRVRGGRAALKQSLLKQAKYNKNRLVRIKGDTNAPLQIIVDIIELVQNAGFVKVQILTQVKTS
ncbi:biopolymer transport protein ExbD [Piscirickettsia salmonis]|uniref:ExbD/TolR family protein n=1 Tax=Piscirickettsia salmonis TaxID=1238 RepID=UPI0012B9C187|nr:biopolymer transporter ExbD [Piscirickettsia salmonis]QGP50309.1 biopolymer transport protein ExbD [Piscirickettsia salmonis]QGP54598.1 biopolymer transport protein ExbD [Piscirickettsia salmonis]QGP59505.1 biopolymer transport protein ExbD [Piscirickettsia salmonis]QGP64203.1 biopolymer transport protein ExbD [Piscirickettsia salmonis]